MELRHTPNCDVHHILMRQILINQMSFYIDFGEHGRRMACLWGDFSP